MEKLIFESFQFLGLCKQKKYQVVLPFLGIKYNEFVLG